MTTLIVAMVTAIASWWLTGAFRLFALDRRLLDVPNERSAHTTPTPQGAGIVIAGTASAAILLYAAIDAISWRHAIGLVGPGGLVAAIGFLDDRRPLPVGVRLLVHFAAAALLVAALADSLHTTISGASGVWWWLTFAAAVVYVVSLLNVTNFMDGIDGLAATEASMAAAGGAVAGYVLTANVAAASAPLAVAAASAGFLIWNWPRAKVFMGDSGSGFLGFMLAGLSLLSVPYGLDAFVVWLILLGVFVVDATMTLVRRILRGERIHEAHSSHAYQHAARRTGSHRAVTGTVMAINLVWLAPLAGLTATDRLDGPVALILAYAPLVVLAWSLGSGRPRP